MTESEQIVKIWIRVWNLHNPIHDVVGSQIDIQMCSNSDLLKLSDGPFKWMTVKRKGEYLLWIYVLPRRGPIGNNRLSRRKGYYKLLYDWLKYGKESKIEERDKIKEEENEPIEVLIKNSKIKPMKQEEEEEKQKESKTKQRNEEQIESIIKKFELEEV